MSYNDGGDAPSLGGIKYPPKNSPSQSIDSDNTIDQRVWRRPSTQGQNPAPQAARNAPPDTDSDDFFMTGKSQTHSKTAVAGKAGIHHLDGEGTQYAFTLEKGLHQRPEGARQHEHNATADAESLDPRTTADVAKGKYNGDTQGGNRHIATGDGSDFGRGSMTRTGQGSKAKDANKLEDCGGY